MLLTFNNRYELSKPSTSKSSSDEAKTIDYARSNVNDNIDDTKNDNLVDLNELSKTKVMLADERIINLELKKILESFKKEKEMVILENEYERLTMEIIKKIEETETKFFTKSSNLKKEMESAEPEKRIESIKLEKETESAKLGKRMEPAKTEKEMESVKLEKKMGPTKLKKEIKLAKLENEMEPTKSENGMESAKLEKEMESTKSEKEIKSILAELSKLEEELYQGEEKFKLIVKEHIQSADKSIKKRYCEKNEFMTGDVTMKYVEAKGEIMFKRTGNIITGIFRK